MNSSIFPQLAVDRNAVHWEDYLGELTPVEHHDGWWFKREDAFAPLGYGGPNGAKLRQLIWYMNRYRPGKSHVLSGASVQSPQLSMSTIVGYHYGLPTRLVVGATKPQTLLRHPNPRIAAGYGAHFEYLKVGYNPVLQREVARLTRPDSLVVQYGITLEKGSYPADEVRKFHEVGAWQVTNLPPEVHRLVVPAGSCNSLTSIILGLLRYPSPVRELYTLGIGPNKLPWARERLDYMGVDTSQLPFRWEHYSLHDNKYARYGDAFKNESHGEIRFHPTYEAKMWRWLREHPEYLPRDDHTCFWIIGSEPDPTIALRYAPEEAA